MQDNNFDRSIRMKLEGLEVPMESADWEGMAERLDHPHESYLRDQLAGMEVESEDIENDWFLMEDTLEKDFDQKIKEKLHGMETAYAAGDWTSMDAKISDPFDAAVRNGLDKASIPYLPGDWERMSERLDAPFDKKIQEKFAAHTVSYRKADWKIMASLLRRKDDPIPLYANWRVYAAAAALLFLFLFGRQILSPEGNAVKKNIPAIAETDTKTKTEGEIHQNQTTPSEFSAENGVSDEEDAGTGDRLIPASEKEAQKLAETGTPISTDKKAAAVENQLPQPIELQGLQAQGAHPRVNLSQHKNFEVPETKKAKIEFAPFIRFDSDPISIDPEAIAYGPELESGMASPNLETSVKKTFPAKGSLQSTALTMGTLGWKEEKASSLRGTQPEPFQKATLIKIPLRAYPRVAVGLYGAAFSSASELNDPGSFGFAVGPRVELQLSSSWSMVTGLLYAEKHFTSSVFNFREDPLNTNVPTIWKSRLKADYQMLEIPLMAKYTFESENKVSFYMQAGITTMLTLREQYHDYDPLSLTNGVTNAFATSPNLDFDALEARDQALSINTYVGNVQIAPGIQAQINPKIRLQLEPYLQLGLQRMGPKRRKINSGGGAVSVIYLLGRKGASKE